MPVGQGLVRGRRRDDAVLVVRPPHELNARGHSVLCEAVGDGDGGEPCGVSDEGARRALSLSASFLPLAILGNAPNYNYKRRQMIRVGRSFIRSEGWFYGSKRS